MGSSLAVGLERDLTEKDILDTTTFQFGIKASLANYIDGITIVLIESPTKPVTPKFSKTLYTGSILQNLDELAIEDIEIELATYSDDIVLELEGGMYKHLSIV